jgi:AhpD family alkylhydroperoxidase
MQTTSQGTAVRNREIGRALAAFGQQQPTTMHALAQLHSAATAEGVLSAKVKELMAVAIAVYAGCEDCVAFHHERAKRAGASTEEALEALGVAVLMGGGPASVHAARAAEEITATE